MVQVDSASFQATVIESEQAICLVYYIDNGNCNSYLRTVERLVDKVNAQTMGIPDSNATAESATVSGVDVAVDGDGDAEGGEGVGSSPSEGKSTKKVTWLKFCAINADENRNLASAFAVQRAKLPITYFIMQSTIIDKISGHVTETKLEAILWKFLEHYQRELNVDLLARMNKESVNSPATTNPIPHATTTDLVGGTSTKFLQDKIMDALVGASMVRLPEESSQLDGLRKTIQQAKLKAHEELQSLYRELGMDIRKLSDADVHEYYYKSSQFIAVAVISSLEALYLARAYAFLGDIARSNVEWARRAVQNDFEPVLGHPTLRRVLALVDTNLVRGDLQLSAVLAARDVDRIRVQLTVMGADDASSTSARETAAVMKGHMELLESQREYCARVLRCIDEDIDSRAAVEAFPSATADALFAMLKDNFRVSKPPKRASSSDGEKGGREEGGRPSEAGEATPTTPMEVTEMGSLEQKRSLLAEERVQQLKTTLTALLQLFASDAQSQAMRARLSSVLY